MNDLLVNIIHQIQLTIHETYKEARNHLNI